MQIASFRDADVFFSDTGGLENFPYTHTDTHTHGQLEKAEAGGCYLFVSHRYGHLLHPHYGAIRECSVKTGISTF